MPLVTASEAGKAQNENPLPKRVIELQSKDLLPAYDPDVNLLEQGVTEGENPVFDLEFDVYGACSESRVDWDLSTKRVVNFT